MFNLSFVRNGARYWNNNNKLFYIVSNKTKPNHCNIKNIVQNHRQHFATTNCLASIDTIADNFTYNQKRSDYKFPFRFLTVLLSGGVLLVSIKSQLQEARCLSTFTVQVDEEVAKSKWQGLKIKLYQYQTCPFCSKARSFFLANNIPFEVEEVHPITKKEIKFSNYKKVPIVVVETEDDTFQVNDSSVIISAFSTYILDNKDRTFKQILSEYTPEQPAGTEEQVVSTNRHELSLEDGQFTSDDVKHLKKETEWRAWADDRLVHIISPNVYRTLSESYQSFQHHTRYGNYKNSFERYLALYGGTVAMWLVSKMLKKKHIKNDDVRVDLYEACNQWTQAIGTKLYMGGNTPNLADVSVYGVLSVMESLPIWKDLLDNTCIEEWYYRTKQHVESPAFTKQHVEEPAPLEQHVEKSVPLEQHVEDPAPSEQHVEDSTPSEQHVETTSS